MPKIASSWFVVSAVVALWLQDPVPRPSPPPPDGRPLPMLEEPAVTPVPRADLPGRIEAPDPLEGLWELRARTVGGQLVDAGRGFMSVHRSLLMVQLFALDPGLDFPLLRAVTYSWQRQDLDGVQLRVVLGHFNLGNGKMQLEAHGRVETRRFELGGDFLRVHQPNGDYLEFVRRG